MIILIGGAPGVGKSVIANALSRKMNILRLVDLDTLRDILRLQSREKDDPVLFMNALNAWEIHGDYSERTVMEGFYAHMRQQVGLSFRLVDSYLTTGKDAILHGAALFPSQTVRYRRRDVHAFIIACPDAASYRTSFMELHKMRTGTVPKDIRIQAGWILHQKLVQEAKDCGATILYGGVGRQCDDGQEASSWVVEQILSKLCS